MTRNTILTAVILVAAGVGGCTQHYLDKADGYMSEERYVDALQYYRKALDSKSELADKPEFAARYRQARCLAAHQQGRQLAQRGAHEAAMEKFQVALEVDPDYAPAREALAASARQASLSRLRQARESADAGDLDAAGLHARRAAELDPDNSGAADAVASLAGRITPPLAPAQELLEESRALQADRRWQQAVATLESAVRAGPDHLPCRAELHRCRETLEHARQLGRRGAEHLRERQLDAAVAALTEALDVWPHNDDAARDLTQARSLRRQADDLYAEAVRHADRSEWDAALAKARQALEVFPGHPEARSFAAGIERRAAGEHAEAGKDLLDRGDVGAAEDAFERALEYADVGEARRGLAEVALARAAEAERRGLFGNALLWYTDAADHVRDRRTLQRIAEMRAEVADRLAFGVDVRVEQGRRRLPVRLGRFHRAVTDEAARTSPAHLEVAGRGAPQRYTAEITVASYRSDRDVVDRDREVQYFETEERVPNPEIRRLRLRLQREREELERLRRNDAPPARIREQEREVNRIRRQFERTPRIVVERVRHEWPYVVHTHRQTGELTVEVRLIDAATRASVFNRTFRKTARYEDQVTENANPDVGVPVDTLELPDDEFVCRELLEAAAPDAARLIVAQAVRAQVDELARQADSLAADRRAAQYIETMVDTAVLLEATDPREAESVFRQLREQRSQRRAVYESWGGAPAPDRAPPAPAPRPEPAPEPRLQRALTVDVAVQTPPDRTGRWEGQRIVPRTDEEWRQRITVTGPGDALRALRPSDVRAFVILTDADLRNPGVWIVRPVMVALPTGVSLVGDAPTVTFQLAP